LGSCGADAAHPGKAFYDALLVRSEILTAEAAKQFMKALGSSNPYVRGAAAAELLQPVLGGECDAAAVLARLDSLPPLPARASESGAVPETGGPPVKAGAAELRTLRAACLSMLERWEEVRRLCGPEAVLPWDRAFGIMGEIFSGGSPGKFDASRREKVLSFLLDGSSLSAGTWLGAQIAARFGDGFGQAPGGAEQAALSGHEAVLKGEFGAGLRFLRQAAEADPPLFIRCPDLIGDLGRAWQFAAPGSEGVEQFSRWERELETGGTELSEAAGASPLSAAGLRYRLLYYAGRIARAGELYEEGAGFFGRAIPLAPDTLQRDACIWYILDMALKTDRGRNAAALVKAFIPRWGDDAYFTDILDRLVRILAADRRWEDMADIYGMIKTRGDRVSVSRYAYILGRAAAEGYYRPGGSGAGTDGAAVRDFLRSAWEAGSAPGALYYRAMSAPLIGEPFLNLAEGGAGDRGAPPGGRMEFLLSFFGHQAAGGPAPEEGSAAGFAAPYIREAEEDLSTGELRLLAGALHDAGLYPEAIRLASSYMDREGYEPDRRDMEFLYPRPFKELIEENARGEELEPALLFGLVRSESAFQAGIVSRAGAVGLAQIMPATAEEMAGRIRRRGGPDYAGENVPDLRDPDVNIHIGAVYLRYLTDRLESPLLALLAYNGGMNRVRRWRAAAPGLPEDMFLETIEFAETREYGRRVFAAAGIYRYLYYQDPPAVGR
jgi:soluble lytic murein transglycosylase